MPRLRPASVTRFSTQSRFVRLGALLALFVGAILGAAPLAGQSADERQPPSGAPALDTAAILASARLEIEAANAAWLSGLRKHDAAMIAAAYADSGVFISAGGAITQGRAAVARMYDARVAHMRAVTAGAVEQQGLAVLSATRVVEWGRAWLEIAPPAAGDAATRSGGQYLTVWQRETDAHWRIVRNLVF